MDLLKQALAEGLSALDEHRAKAFLAGCGIPVNRESVASDPAAAAEAAERIGFPVVLKAVGSTLHHKTEVGGVVLNVKSGAEVKAEGLRLLKIPGCEGLLVQEMVKGHREFVCGMTRDAQLGPCVMFGLGGIYTELLRDVSFRVAPLTEYDALQMMDEIRAKKILDEFRGKPAVDRKALAKTLIAVGQIGLDYDEVKELDINPLIISDNKPVAVDALVILANGKST